MAIIWERQTSVFLVPTQSHSTAQLPPVHLSQSSSNLQENSSAARLSPWERVTFMTKTANPCHTTPPLLTRSTSIEIRAMTLWILQHPGSQYPWSNLVTVNRPTPRSWGCFLVPTFKILSKRH